MHALLTSISCCFTYLHAVKDLDSFNFNSTSILIILSTKSLRETIDCLKSHSCWILCRTHLERPEEEIHSYKCLQSTAKSTFDIVWSFAVASIYQYQSTPVFSEVEKIGNKQPPQYFHTQWCIKLLA